MTRLKALFLFALGVTIGVFTTECAPVVTPLTSTPISSASDQNDSPDEPYPAPEKDQDPPYPVENSLETGPAGQEPTFTVDIPVPDDGKAAISGILYSYTIHQVIPGTAFYLSPAVGPDKQDVSPLLVGPQIENGDIPGRSESNGGVQLNNISPGNYYLVVWAPYSWSVAQVSNVDHKPRLLTLQPNQRTFLETIYLSWP